MSELYVVRQNDGIAIKELGNDCGHALTISRAAVIRAIAIFSIGEVASKLGHVHIGGRTDCGVWISYTTPNLSIEGKPFSTRMMAMAILLLGITREEEARELL